jgi:phosphoglycolate phosphatase-like HAD superfamily hydrolase
MGRLVEIVVILDGDNTLWDTNSSFEQAQLAILATLESAGHRLIATDKLATLRRVDHELIAHFGVKEYEFRVLVLALVRLAEGLSPREAAARAARDGAKSAEDEVIVEEAMREFNRSLAELPPLLPGARALLEELATNQRSRAITFLVSEGKDSRLTSVIDRHHLGDYFEGITVTTDKRAAMEACIAKGRNLLRSPGAKAVVVGDSLKADIANGNAVGAFTIYKPAGFLGSEAPDSAEDTPDVVANDLFDVARQIDVLRTNSAMR